MNEQPGAPSPDAAADESEHLKKLLRDWTELEELGIRSLQRIRARTRNRLLRQVLSVLMHDSVQHRRVQEILLAALEEGTVDVSAEEVDEIWAAIQEHDALEQASIDKAHAAREASTNPVVRYFLGYLETDENKHHQMLEDLAEIKRK